MGLRIALGQTVYVERRVGDSHIKGTSHIIGARPPRYLFLEAPVANNKLLFSSANEKCIIRFLREGTLVGFRAQVLKIITEPFPMMILEYPPDIEEVTVRQFERVDCCIEAILNLRLPSLEGKALRPPTGVRAKKEGAETISIGTGMLPPPPVKSLIYDLSVGGCMLEVKAHDWRNLLRKIVVSIQDTVEVIETDEWMDQLILNTVADIHFELPMPAKQGGRDVTCEVRRIGRTEPHTFLGMQFKAADPELNLDIQSIIKHQHDFFTRHEDYF